MEKPPEKLKQALAKFQDFNLYQAFKWFDIEDTGFIFQDEFSHHTIQLTQKQYNRVLREQAGLIFSRYKLEFPSKLTYREFCNIFLPSDPQLSDDLMARKLGPISEDTSEVMGTLLKAHLDLEQSREYLRQKLNNKMDQNTWSTADLFEACDQEGKGYLTIRDME